MTGVESPAGAGTHRFAVPPISTVLQSFFSNAVRSLSTGVDYRWFGDMKARHWQAQEATVQGEQTLVWPSD